MALVDYIAESYRESFDSLRNSSRGQDNLPSIREIVMFILNDDAGDTLFGDRLWPQLWAMQQVEPLVNRQTA